MTIWFSSDHHFGHKRIIEMGERPFQSLEDMDRAMESNWRLLVRPGDTVYHLGDFSFHRIDKTNEILARLPGKKILIKGNHDSRKNVKRMVGWESVLDYHELRVEGRLYVLMHYPIESWKCMRYGAIHLHGHSHGSREPRKGRHDVGVDCNNFAPITLERAIQAASQN